MKETDEFLEENFFVSHPFLLFVMPINQTEIEKLKEREKKMERGDLSCLLVKFRLICKIRDRDGETGNIRKTRSV